MDAPDAAADPGAHAGPTVDFLCTPEEAEVLEPPRPAGKYAPDWFRRLPRNTETPMEDGLPGLTVKACMPVTDAFSAGWIIPLSFDVTINRDESGNFHIGQSREATFQQLAAHTPGQIGAPNPPFGPVLPLKWNIPWRVRAPEGVSLLFTHPLNHFELPFTTFSGLVDSDRFAARVNAPFVWTAPNGEVRLNRGTPLVQVIPAPRDALALRGVARASTPEEAAQEAEHLRLKHSVESVYAREFRVSR